MQRIVCECPWSFIAIGDRRNRGSSSRNFQHPERATARTEYKCIGGGTVRNDNRVIATRDHAIPCYRECYGNLAPRCRCSLSDYRRFIVPCTTFRSLLVRDLLRSCRERPAQFVIGNSSPPCSPPSFHRPLIFNKLESPAFQRSKLRFTVRCSVHCRSNGNDGDLERNCQ